ncbi:formate dehydrogenase accessory sulfurtransferase FdhD [Paracoccus pacificus]|uniref:Sulfur carrier protein FdhD n=1 Tax=Paracoccus pacificus TaxID=1463598 RepID=A0ABW4R8P9_9RHOB
MAGRAPARRWRAGHWVDDAAPDCPREWPVAIVIDGATQAVLMATPADLHDFALGFALTEGVIASTDEVTAFEEARLDTDHGPAAEARLWLAPGHAARLAERRRSMVGPVGCGLCGVDSISAALPEVVRVRGGLSLSPQQIGPAMQALSDGQVLNAERPGIHAAGWWIPGQPALVREDVGRHNALDKLAGALARDGVGDGVGDGGAGAVVMSSRLSVDLVQKCARIGAPVLIGAGVATELAIAWAEAAGITLIARARRGDFELFTHPQRIKE